MKLKAKCVFCDKKREVSKEDCELGAVMCECGGVMEVFKASSEITK